MTVGEISTRNLQQAATDIERRGGLVTLTNVDVAKTLRNAAAQIEWLQGQLFQERFGKVREQQPIAGHAATDVDRDQSGEHAV